MKLLSPLFLLFLLALSPVALHAADLDLDKAVKVGSGKITVIEFTDPDCPYCRKAEEFFSKRTDVTRYIFLVPLPMHPDAPAKAKYILSAADGAAAFTAVMGGSLDRKKPEGITELGKQRLAEHEQIAKNAKVGGMPTFIISGVIIEGLDTNRINKLLP
jgi:thiol:disulfide interchange protein DsbC